MVSTQAGPSVAYVEHVSDDLDVRRPELRNVRRTGTIRWYEEDKGYGRITADDGEVLFVHFSAIEADGYRSLTEGERVSFVWRGGIQDHGRHRADEVRTEANPRPEA